MRLLEALYRFEKLLAHSLRSGPSFLGRWLENPKAFHRKPALGSSASSVAWEQAENTDRRKAYEQPPRASRDGGRWRERD